MASKYFINDLEFTKEDFYIYLYNYITEYNIYNKNKYINYNKIEKSFKNKRYYYYKLNNKEFKKIIEK